MNDPDKKPPKAAPVPDADDDRTVIAGIGGDAPDPDRTILATGMDAPQEDDPDRTILAPNPAPPAEEDADRTILASVPPRSQAGTPEAEAGPVVDEFDPDHTIVVTGLQQGQGGASAPGAEPETDDATVIVTQQSSAPADPVAATQTSSFVPVPPGTAPTPLSSLEPGLVINNMYRVEERLDQGGMGRVFRGVEIGTGESVAIKVILPEMAEDATVARMFRREARTLRQLHHDAIVRYFAYVPPDEQLNLHALVMGFIEGTKLSDHLKEKGALTRAQVIRLTLRLADGLARAHEIGVVHRDLSPDNIMLPDGDISKAVIIDFGISRSSTVKDVTIGNEFAGKLKYVSPEQLGAFGGEAEAPSDVYSLGLLMIAMISGGPMNMGGSIVEAVQMRQAVPDLSDLPEEFQPLLKKMLEPDPANRIRNMGTVTEALKSMEDGTGFGGSRLFGTLPPAPDKAVPGLQAVPIAATSSNTSGPKPLTREARAAVRRQRSGGAGRVVTFLALLLTLAGGAGYYFYGDRFMPSVSGTGGGEADPVTAGLERVEGSRATFLAQTVPDTCAYATRRARGENAGLIEAFGQDLRQLQHVGMAFGEKFGSAPDVVGRSVAEAHCPALEFAQRLQGTRGSGIELALSAHSTPRTEGIIGTLHGSAGRQNWLALVGPNGQVYSLMRQFEDPIGDQRQFAFRMPSAPPGIYLLLATASGKALVRAGAMQDGMAAGDIMPLMLRELAVDGQGAADIAFLEVTR